MKRIDKSVYREDFNTYSRDYLRMSYNEDDCKFIPRLADEVAYYNGFSSRQYRRTAHPADSRFHGWLDILLEETENRCCYCMRHLSGNDISVEHLVPENFGSGKDALDEQEEYDYYAGVSADIHNNVELGSVFDANAQANAGRIDDIARFPHLIAHSNLFPACKNDIPGCSCNNFRGNKRVLPLMLMDDVETFVDYTEEGEMELLFEDIDMVQKTLEALDINTNELKLIRKLWYKFSRMQIRLDENTELTSERVNGWLRDVLHLGETDVIPLEYQDFAKEEADGSLRKFKLFLQYYWFYDYYLNKYPIVNP